MPVIICVDRDNDIGEKTGISGPIYGVKDNLKTANELLLADPEDSDANTIFAAVKLAKEMKKEVVTITGHRKVGVKSDKEVFKQLDKVAKKTKAKKAVLVTDGAEDEFVIPLIQNKFQIVSIKRVIIKQSQQLEGTYYMVNSFIKDLLKDKDTSRVLLGLPALAFLLLALFGATGWRVILFGLGAFLLVKGFQIEGFFGDIFQELQHSLNRGKITFFMYTVSILFLIIGIANGYSYMNLIGYEQFIKSGSAFVFGSFYYFLISVVIAWFGKSIMSYKNKQKFWRVTTLSALAFSSIIVLRAGSELLLKPEVGFSNLIYSITLGFGLVILSVFAQRINK